MARPTKYKAEYCEFSVKFMGKGFSKEALAGRLGVSRDTIYEWCKANPAFSDAIKRGESRSIYFWEKKGLDGMMGKIKHFKPAVWIFTMKRRFGWRDDGREKKDSFDEILKVSPNQAESYNGMSIKDLLKKYSYLES